MTTITGYLDPCSHCAAGPLASCTSSAGTPLPYAHLERLLR